MNKKIFSFAVIMIILAVASRLIKHPMNFAPMAAIGIFSGYYIKTKLAVFIPIIAMLISDFFIGFYDWKLLLVVYASIAISFVFGKLLQKSHKWRYVFMYSVISSLIFFLTTNSAVWTFSNWYPHTLSGLVTCLAEGLPFLKNSILGDLFYSTVLFGALEIAVKFVNKKETQAVMTPLKI